MHSSEIPKGIDELVESSNELLHEGDVNSLSIEEEKSKIGLSLLKGYLLAMILAHKTFRKPFCLF